jgi:hypothetical protein
MKLNRPNREMCCPRVLSVLLVVTGLIVAGCTYEGSGPGGSSGVLGFGRFVTSCEDQAQSVCGSELPGIAVGAEVTIEFIPDSSDTAFPVTAVSDKIFQRPFHSALVSIGNGKLADFVNMSSFEVASVSLEGLARGSGMLYEIEARTISDRLLVGCNQPNWNPERLYLVPRAEDGSPLVGVLPWILDVVPGLATARAVGNRIELVPEIGTGKSVNAVLEVTLPGRPDFWYFPLRVCPAKEPLPSDDVLDDAREDATVILDAWSDLEPDQDVPVDGDEGDDVQGDDINDVLDDTGLDGDEAGAVADDGPDALGEDAGEDTGVDTDGDAPGEES